MGSGGLFIVIEGTDGSGKTTQVKLLAKKLNSFGKKILFADFPRYYNSPLGKLVGEFLIGKHGKFKTASPYLVVFPYMFDEYVWSRDIGRPWVNKGGIILSNRYFTSNVHQIAKLKTKARKKYRNWLWRIGYKDLKLMRPDLVIFLDVPPGFSNKMLKSKKERSYLSGKKKDLAEKDLDHQQNTYREYLYTLKHQKEWIAIKCTKNGSLETKEEVHKKIWKVLERRFKLSNIQPLLEV